MLTSFLEPGLLADGDLCLLLEERMPADPTQNFVPMYRFQMRASGMRVGTLDLRLGDSAFIKTYAGQIGYSVDPPYRGNHYAARAVRLIRPLARAHGLHPLWITCNPDNYASRRTCELAGAELVEVVDLPRDCSMYAKGERRKCRYRLDV